MKKTDVISFETRKSLHINLTRDTHAAFKVLAFENDLSMQEILEAVAIQIIEETPYMVKFLQDLKIRKREKQLSKFTATDAETLYDVIAGSDPAGNEV
jgi:hypothetical protein